MFDSKMNIIGVWNKSNHDAYLAEKEELIVRIDGESTDVSVLSGPKRKTKRRRRPGYRGGRNVTKEREAKQESDDATVTTFDSSAASSHLSSASLSFSINEIPIGLACPESLQEMDHPNEPDFIVSPFLSDEDVPEWASSRYVAPDCETTRIGPDYTKSVLSRASVVDWHRDPFYDSPVLVAVYRHECVNW